MKGRLWSKDFIVALSVAVFLSFVFYLLVTSMAGYAISRFDASEAWAGFAASAFVVGALLARVLTGKFLDFVGRYRVLLVAFGLSVLFSVLYLPANSLPLLIVVRLAHGMTFGAGHTAIMAAVQDIIPAHRRAEGTGYFSTSTTLAAATGPALALVLIRDYGYHWLFIASIGFTLIGVLGLLFLTVPERTPAPEERAQLFSFHPATLLDLVGLRIGSIMLLCGIAYSGVMTFLAGYASHLGMDETAPLFFLAFAISSLVSRLTLGRVQDKHGDNIVVYPLVALFLCAMLLLAVAWAAWVMVLAGVCAGIGFGTLLSSTQAITVNVAGPVRLGRATATYFLMMDLGFGIGPIILGAVVSAVSFSGMYVLTALLVLAAGLVYHWVHGRRPGGGLSAGRVSP